MEPAAGPSTIVVAVDFSEPSLRALRWAITEASRSGREVLAVHAWQADEDTDPRAPGCLSSDLFLVDRELMLDRAIETARTATAPVRGSVVDGAQRTVLIRLSGTAAMLVLGERRRPWFVPSLARYCARHARCPVALIGQHALGAPSPAPRAWFAGHARRQAVRRVQPGN